MFAREALLAIHILCLAFWLIKLWPMTTPIKLIIFISVGQFTFWPRKSKQQQINLVWHYASWKVRNFTSSLHFALRYLGFSNVLHIWSVRAIPTYREYQLCSSPYHCIKDALLNVPDRMVTTVGQCV